jgi:hypothetical protein
MTTNAEHRASIASMTSEFFREAAVLLIVFGWLDRAAHDKPFFEGFWPAGVLGTATLSFAFGVFLERKQPGATVDMRPP